MSQFREGASAAGADGGREIVAFLAGGDGDETLDLERRADADEPARRLVLRRPSRSDQERTDGNVLDRHVLRLAPLPSRQPAAAGRGVALFPPRTLVVTDDPSPIPGGVSTLVVGPDGLHYLDQGVPTTEAGVGRLVADLSPAHLRVVVDVSRATTPYDPDDPAHRTIRRAHDALFLAVRALAPDLDDESSVAVVVLGGIGGDSDSDSGDQRLHPLTGLFTGFTKVLALEQPVPRVLAVVHDATTLRVAGQDVEAELASEQLLPVVHLAGGVRLGVRAEALPAPAPTPGGTTPLTRESVVVAAGGARGIGAEILKALARSAGPRIFVLGTSDVGADNRALLEAGRPAFIRSQVDWMTVPAANAEFERLLRAEEARTTLAELARYCGPERVTYLRCDVRDGSDVSAAADRVLAEGRPVDLLLNVAGLIRTALVEQKTLVDFAAVRDVKVLAHANLTRAFAGRRPRRWCNFGSYAGYFGAPGETDYSSANDFLYSASREPGEFTIGFSLWGEDGFASKGLFRERMASVALLTPMSTAEGVGHFLAELPAPAPWTVQIGPLERSAIEREVPGYLAWCAAPSPAPSPTPAAASPTATAVPTAASPRHIARADCDTGFFVEQAVARTDDCVTAVRTFDLRHDGYLLQHLVGGHPTLPGSFFPEIAAQVARLLCPEKVAVGFEDLWLESFLRVYGPDRPHTVQIAAQRRAFDRVHVRILHDVIAPNGRVLVQDRLHASLDVRLADRPIPAPHWPLRNGDGDSTQPVEPLVNPLYLDTGAIGLRGMFRLTRDERRGPNGSQYAGLVDHSAEARRWFPGAHTPMLVLEAVAQMLKVQPASRPLTIAIPRRIRRIELFSASGEPSELYCTPRDADLYLETDDATNRGVSVAVTPGGQVVARISGMYVAVLDRLPQEARRDVERPAAHQVR